MKTASTLADKETKLKLVAVTKSKSVDEILKMITELNVKRIAENRLNEAKQKFPLLPKELEKHFIGKLQSRKIPEIVSIFDVIQTIENEKQAKLISKEGKKIDVMIQINISGLENRSGVLPGNFTSLKTKLLELPNISLIGVMGLASQNEERAKFEFKLLKSMQGDLDECSMGMSDDYKIAIEEGSTMLRLGSVLFNEPLPKLPNFE